MEKRTGAGALRVPAYAKINLTLDVGALRPDGYHQVTSVMQTIDLADTLLISVAPAGIEVSCDAPDVPAGEENLAHRALATLAPLIPGGIRVDIRKRIPRAAGLGGGSSDAAAALKGANSLYGLGLGERELLAAAAGVGSDVPFFIVGGTALAEGRGELVKRLPTLPVFWLVVVKPGFGVKTGDIYRLYRESAKGGRTSLLLRALEAGDRDGIIAALGNDLESVTCALHPEVAALKERLLERGALKAVMAGSGPAVYGIFPGEAEARLAAGELKREMPGADVFLTRTCRCVDAVGKQEG
ncbi:MAG: 4-diphosphocytidyl-2-C-methyl-D-erythritol kinase [Thermacetogenium sp.]|jgi:4-diphosphocytidyl-2-C-methyl-D-erythritol kinase|nr:4-diphosphocytidyl-2-C-methyl-D-erythritol kinase [Thermacetogenium sp.]